MNPCRLILLITATLITGALLASYWVETAVGYNLVPEPISILLRIGCVVSWQGFIAVQCVDAINTRADRRFLQVLAAIRTADADGEQGDQARRTIDAHLAALQDIATPAPRTNGGLGLVK